MGHAHGRPHTNKQSASCSAKQQRRNDNATSASSPSEAIAIVLGSDQIGPFYIQNSEKRLSDVDCSRQGPITDRWRSS